MPLQYKPEPRETHAYAFDPNSNRQKAAARNSSAAARVPVEGEYVNATEIGARLGITPAAARARLTREQKKPGRVTWEGLAREK